MGRIQKKKTSQKKRKTDPGDQATAQLKAADAQAALPAETPNKIVKKQAASPPRSAAISKTPREKNFIDKSLQFLREVKVELKKVTWPSRKQTLGSTAVVIVLVMIISLFLGIADIGLSSLIRLVLQ